MNDQTSTLVPDAMMLTHILPGNGSPQEGKSPQFSNLNFLRGFANPMQKKVTRGESFIVLYASQAEEIQMGNRRNDEAQSLTANQHRPADKSSIGKHNGRQFKHRGLQMHLLIHLGRTHRERKEQYIKALEAEIARLREAFVAESATVQNHLRHSEILLREQQQETMLLREILNSRGIAFEVELQQRKNSLGLGGPQNNRGISPSYAVPRTTPFFTTLPPSTSQAGMSEIHHPGYANGANSVISGHSPGSQNNPSPQTHHSHSPPEHQETGGYRDKSVTDMPGVFEKEPQLGIDFILA